MTTTSVRARRSAAPRAILVALLSAVALMLGGTAASAHDTVVGTSPGDGETQTTAPTQVTVEISAVPQSIGSRMVITSSDGTVLFDGEPTITDRVASVELPAVPNDSYQVAWRLVSSDGHPIDGTFGFVVDDPAAVAPTAEATTDAATPTTEESSEAATTGAGTTEAAPSSTTTTGTAADSSDDGSGTSWVPVALIVVVVAGLVLLVLFRRRTALQDQS